jgi:REP element-mobilizing transposase RayT
MVSAKTELRSAGPSPACRPEAGGRGVSGEVRSAGVPPASALAAGGVPVRWRSRGYLPHLDGPTLVQHVVFRLVDSLPAGLRNAPVQARRSDRIAAIDAALDQGHGRRDLAVPAVAELVQIALLTFDADRYALIAWCVMPNHVHALLTISPGYRLDRIVHSWKSYTAKEANRLLRRGGAFWAREYFDRFMRDSDHLARTAAYIEGNPVKAGLCEGVSDWRFSSAWGGWGRRDAGGPDRSGDFEPPASGRHAGGTPAVRTR